MFKIGLGQSEDIDTLSSVHNAIEQCRQQLGATVQLTEATRERMLENTSTTLQSVVEKISGTWQPSAALMFSCFSRKQILGTRTREELQILENLLPVRTPITGFYSRGEFSPLQRNQFYGDRRYLGNPKPAGGNVRQGVGL